MDTSTVVDLGREALFVAVLIASPLLGVALVVVTTSFIFWLTGLPIV